VKDFPHLERGSRAELAQKRGEVTGIERNLICVQDQSKGEKGGKRREESASSDDGFLAGRRGATGRGTQVTGSYSTTNAGVRERKGRWRGKNALNPH